MSSGDSFQQFETLLLENIEDGALNLEIDDSDPGWDLIQTMPAQNVAGRRTDTAGTAGYEAQWKVRLQRGGRVTGGAIDGNTHTFGGKNADRAMGQAADDLYLDPADTPSRSWQTIRIFLKRLRGQLTMNMTQKEAIEAANSVENFAGEFIEDAAYLLRQLIVSMFWSDGTGAIAQVNGSGQTITETAGGNAVTVDNGTVFRFVEGQRYVSAAKTTKFTKNAGSGVNGALGTFRCVNVDTDANTVYFESETGVGTVTLADDDWIILADLVDFSQTTTAAQTLACNGVHNLMVASGNFPGTSLSVTDYSSLKAFIHNSSGSNTPPTPELFAEPLDKLLRIKANNAPSAMVAEPSIWTKYNQIERQTGAVYQTPMGGAFTGSGGVDGPVFTHNNYAFARLTSSRCRPNTVYFLNPSTWFRFMPLGNVIRWVMSNSVSGGSRIWRMVTSGRQLTRLMAADFDFFAETGLKDPRCNIIVENVANS